jgi:alkanesulfonate monooxygenase SsuD/methylene tetrahydromethanopterin reductase-like flavin-dependent oxidoreductase (luciferase family)
VASAEAILSLAKCPEGIGYDSLWLTDVLLYPVQPPEFLSGRPVGSLSEVYKTVFDPILALTFAAAHTSQVTLGTSVLVMS